MIPKRLLNVIAIGVVFSISIFFFYPHIPKYQYGVAEQPPPTPEEKKERPPGPIYKDKSQIKTYPPIEDNFPLLGDLDTGKLPAIPSWNRPPSTHVKEHTPLFIGFTRNWPLLQQCVLSYIVAGWPPGDIYVVDNTGTMKSNFDGKLTLQNPFYLNVKRLQDVFKVNVIATPTLLTFAQLQNFYIFTSIEKGWDYYWWSHMDILALTEERWEPENPDFKPLYTRALEKLREATSEDYLRNPDTGEKPDWGIQFFAYDWLALNNVKSFVKVGGWDTFVSYYTTDCDMHGRFHMAGIHMPVADCGRISDVGGSIDLNLLFRKKIDPSHPPKTVAELDKLPEDDRGGLGFDKIIAAVKAQTDAKNSGKEERNSWQYKQTGGQGEPFYRDPQGFEKALQMMIATGVETYHEKWGWKTCNLGDGHLKLDDAWQVEKNYDEDPKCPPK